LLTPVTFALNCCDCDAVSETEAGETDSLTAAVAENERVAAISARRTFTAQTHLEPMGIL
jgi:hypothetical protein